MKKINQPLGVIERERQVCNIQYMSYNDGGGRLGTKECQAHLTKHCDFAKDVKEALTVNPSFPSKIAVVAGFLVVG